MSEVEQYQGDGGAVERRLPVSESVSSLATQVQDMSDAHKLATAFANTGFAGPFKGKPDDLAVAILKGNALGIPAHEVGGKIYVVHGTPALYGQTALAIAKNNGYRFRRVNYSAERVTVECLAPNGDLDTADYTIERAKREGLVAGNKQYNNRPEKMLYWKCIGELSDQFFPHLTGGLKLKEDLEISEPIKAEAEVVHDKKPVLGGESSQKQALSAAVFGSVDDGVDAPESEAELIDRINTAVSMDELMSLSDSVAEYVAAHPEENAMFTEAWTAKQSALGA